MDSIDDAQDKQSHIRNFAIIAHIDHGKSTLADRLMEMTGTVEKRDMRSQLLDSNPIERERGITIKLAPVRMMYKTHETYVLNLIDTPGHVDFAYEVSRSLAACEGALLVVDATAGVQAQTLANLAHARGSNLTIIPLINKIDLPNARIEETLAELEGLGFKRDEVIQISAKTGRNVELVLEAIVQRIPPPSGKVDSALRALVFSSQYDPHKGVVVFVRVVDGRVGAEVASCPHQALTRLKFIASGAEVTPIEVGYFSPQMKPSTGLSTGEVGYIATGLKDVKLAKVGDTVTRYSLFVNRSSQNKKFQTNNDKRTNELTGGFQPLPGYKEPKPMVFLSLFPINSEDIEFSREAMERLRLSDSAFTFRPIYSQALGNGFHCGFLGLLHAEIVQERLSREFNLQMIATAPSVEYRLKVKGKKTSAEVAKQNFDPDFSFSRDKLQSFTSNPSRSQNEAGQNFIGSPQTSLISIQSPVEYPDPSLIEEVREPIMQTTIYTPSRYVGAVMGLAQEKRGVFVDQVYHLDQVEFTYLMPLSEMIVDFFDRLKSVSEGYASLDYEFYDYQKVNLAKIDILVNKEKVDALSFFAVEGSSQRNARSIVERLAKVIPRGQFEIPIQAAIGGQVIARADVKSFRKDVTAKLYGGDRSRKDKLLEKQKKGKAKMKMIGRVSIPQEAFFEVLKRD